MPFDLPSTHFLSSINCHNCGLSDKKRRVGDSYLDYKLCGKCDTFHVISHNQPDLTIITCKIHIYVGKGINKDSGFSFICNFI